MKNYNDKCGSHIIYVNGRYEGNDDIVLMMKDFHQCRPEQIKSEILSKVFRGVLWWWRVLLS